LTGLFGPGLGNFRAELTQPRFACELMPAVSAVECCVNELRGETACLQVGGDPQGTLAALCVVGDIVLRKARIVEQMLLDELRQDRIDGRALEPASLEPRAQLGAREVAARDQCNRCRVCRCESYAVFA
jgi:hypothetical protein